MMWTHHWIVVYTADDKCHRERKRPKHSFFVFWNLLRDLFSGILSNSSSTPLTVCAMEERCWVGVVFMAEDWMIYRGPGSLFHARSLPPPLPSASFSVFLCVAGRAYWREGVGVELNHMTATARKLGPLHNNSSMLSGWGPYTAGLLHSVWDRNQRSLKMS